MTFLSKLSAQGEQRAGVPLPGNVAGGGNGKTQGILPMGGRGPGHFLQHEQPPLVWMELSAPETPGLCSESDCSPPLGPSPPAPGWGSFLIFVIFYSQVS